MRSTAGSQSDACAGDLSGKKIILGLAGSIAAYKGAYIASALVKRGADVHVVMTESAKHLIGAATLWSITGNAVISEMFEPPAKPEITHVSLPESADLLLVAPATANIIAKFALGLADDMLSTMALVVRCPVVIAPAMNVHMYTNPVVAANLAKLRERGWVVVEPESGRLACGDEGVGRLAEPDDIVGVVSEVLAGAAQDYAGVNVLVTAGPTCEPIDPVRFISNRSSGKMGYAIAEAAASRGARVTLVTGPTSLPAPAGVDMVRVETTLEMRDAVMGAADSADVFISAAAPADFAPSVVSTEKIKKSDRVTLDMEKTCDILAEFGSRKGRTILVGFAAETSNLEKYAARKLESKNLDMIVANDVSEGSDIFGSDSNQVTILSRSGEKEAWPRMPKREVADGILDYVRNHFMEESS